MSTIHGVNYADYSHGVRLVSHMALINGALESVQEILQDSSTAGVLSGEGPIHNVWELLSSYKDSPTAQSIPGK